jgi:hypothetical protein
MLSFTWRAGQTSRVRGVFESRKSIPGPDGWGAWSFALQGSLKKLPHRHRSVRYARGEPIVVNRSQDIIRDYELQAHSSVAALRFEPHGHFHRLRYDCSVI